MVVRTKQGQHGMVRGRRTGAQVGSGSTPGTPAGGGPAFVNGDFATGDLTGWTIVEGTPSVSAGAVNLTSSETGTPQDRIRQATTVPSGAWNLGFTTTALPGPSVGTVQVLVGTTAGGFDVYLNFGAGGSLATVSLPFTSPGGTLYFQFNLAKFSRCSFAR